MNCCVVSKMLHTGTTSETAPDLSDLLPGYTLLERLGEGGFGEVWKAQAPGGMLKAVKVLHGDLGAIDADEAPIERELQALSRVRDLRHPFILSLERLDVIDGKLIVVTELADCNLWDWFRACQDQGLPGIAGDELLGYMEDAAEALDFMSRQFNLQHLDIKPHNLFLVSGHVKIGDFGLVQDLSDFARPVAGIVTPAYAAPETSAGQISRWCDQYSLAIVYVELLTGQRPYSGIRARQLLVQHLQEQPDLEMLPASDRPAVARALAKNPQERFPSCLDFVAALRGANPSWRVRLLQSRPGSAADTGNSPATLADNVDTLETLELPPKDAVGAPIADAAPAFSPDVLPAVEKPTAREMVDDPGARGGTRAALEEQHRDRERAIEHVCEQLRRDEAELIRLTREMEFQLARERAGLASQRQEWQLLCKDRARVEQVEAELRQREQEIERERERLHKDETALKAQMRDIEVELSHERADLARQWREAQRLHAALAMAEALQADYQTREAEFERRHEQLKQDEAELMKTVRNMEVHVAKERAELAHDRYELRLIETQLKRQLAAPARNGTRQEKWTSLGTRVEPAEVEAE